MANTTKHLTRRLALHSPLHRPVHATTTPRALFSTTASPLQQQPNPTPPSRAPALSDIDSKGVNDFYARQEDFRTRVAAAKEQADSQSHSQFPQSSSSSASASATHDPDAAKRLSATASDAPAFSSVSGSAALASISSSAGARGDEGLSDGGSVVDGGSGGAGEHREAARTQDKTSSQTAAKEDAEKKQQAQQKRDDSPRGRKLGALSSLIYGTEEGRQHEREIERSYSQVLARGKYVHSIVFHEVKPDKVDEYVRLVGDFYPKVAQDPENMVHLVGSWRTEVGDCDTFVHIWEYRGYHGYHDSLNRIHSHPTFGTFDSSLRPLLNSKRTSLMQEFSFWPTATPRKLGGIFELRSYTLHPGNLLEWEQHWRKGLEARKQIMEGVGAWFVQIGDLNTVHHLWQFPNLEERKRNREMSWGIEGWSDTVHRTVPLIQRMRSRVLMPMNWSPIG
ncbi:MAG: hypothetical protein M1831_002803 [Alyxoria varia]|nr:MAG: hypothetical protein M1831_002803 [Alyxoria varia]